ncbi:polyphosphate kinase 1 [Paenibacillus sp. ACRRX]|uniref:polyphosphate kinase 1 n=1 Tax=unclassified Paenibacillus TaxID=185978 RepID=UPI001EF4EC87|nr:MULTISPECIES: polyphosphate kinase 1 [unclassified Paenibacillus]MCG7410030.1 polyphosphate kinase 1 [Paenibacillus sp. ACRRX]MDK8183979.1 polyphosphate kinase 1 [Paenibacillus sp. UMB4589-SE434]
MRKTLINREWSLLAFHRRVLEEGYDKSNPLMERCKFLAISCSNVDEFFMVRAASVVDQILADYHKQDHSGSTPQDTLRGIEQIARQIVADQYKLYEHLRTKLRESGVHLKRAHRLSLPEKQFLKSYFTEHIFPVLTPMVVDQSRPFPLIQNKSLNIGLLVQDPEDGETAFATVAVPEVLSRLVELPSHGQGREFVLLEDVMKMHMDMLFSGYDITEIKAYRITRNADLDIDEDGAEDLLKEIEQSLKMRKWGNVVRLEVEAESSKEMIRMITQDGEDDPDAGINYVDGPLDLTFMNKITQLTGYDHLHDAPFQPPMPHEREVDLLEWIREQDRLLHHPFDSFGVVVNLIRRAAKDPDVLAIKQTLYRVSGNSPIIQALIEAAENKKQVTVLVEIKARFDEENNIHWAKRLEQAGCHVIYGLVGLKTHLKMLLIVRREETGIRRYVHLGTGNYNDVTANFYTDMGLLTVNAQIGSDASTIFNMLSGYSVPSSLNKCSIAPLFLRKRLEQLIEYEIDVVKKGGTGRIMLKMNALVDVKLIHLLYKASKAGVRIDLIVRGVCCLRPGVKDLSEHITVKSIVGRFLEHTRIFYFHHGGKDLTFLSSADWMPRNLDRRVEAMFPIELPELKHRIMDILSLYMKDNVKSRYLLPDGSYLKQKTKPQLRIHAQQLLIKEASRSHLQPVTLQLQPRQAPDRVMTLKVSAYDH